MPLQQKSYTQGCFPDVRLRRNRSHAWLRRLVAETRLSVDDLIQVFFIRNQTQPAEMATFPGIRRLTIPELLKAAEKLKALKIPAIALFPYYHPSERLPDVHEMLTADNLVCQAIRALKADYPEIGIITDVALDCYTVHGQDGLIKDGRILNDESLGTLADYAVIQAQAGADIIAPSDMMDGRVKTIRKKLDQAGFDNVGIMSYAAKYASHFYGPFREAVGSKHCLGQADKKTYQLDPFNWREALREVAMDIEEGADMVMVKPGLPYLDVVARVKNTFHLPTFVFQVSGEYAMIYAGAERCGLDYRACLMETLTAFKRAGADGILTYAAIDAALALQEG